MKTNSKPVHAAFCDQFQVDMVAAGITPHMARFGIEKFTVETKAGPYTCELAKPIPGSKIINLAVFGHFADPVMAAAVVDCNPHTGKWNFHPGDRKDEDGARRAASAIVQRILSLREL